MNGLSGSSGMLLNTVISSTLFNTMDQESFNLENKNFFNKRDITIIYGKNALEQEKLIIDAGKFLDKRIVKFQQFKWLCENDPNDSFARRIRCHWITTENERCISFEIRDETGSINLNTFMLMVYVVNILKTSDIEYTVF